MVTWKIYLRSVWFVCTCLDQRPAIDRGMAQSCNAMNCPWPRNRQQSRRDSGQESSGSGGVTCCLLIAETNVADAGSL